MIKARMVAAVALFFLLGWMGFTVLGGRFAVTRSETAIPDSLHDGAAEMGESGALRKTKAHERNDDPSARERQELRQRLNSLLPPVDASAKSTLFEVKLRLGESIAVGGFKTVDGHIKATLITPVKVETLPNGDFKVEVKSKMILPDAQAIESLGLGALGDGGRERLQQYVRLSPEVMNHAGNQAGLKIVGMPSVTTASGQRFEIDIGDETQSGYVLSGMVSEDRDGGDVLLRMRVEYDASIPPSS